MLDIKSSRVSSSASGERLSKWLGRVSGGLIGRGLEKRTRGHILPLTDPRRRMYC